MRETSDSGPNSLSNASAVTSEPKPSQVYSASQSPRNASRGRSGHGELGTPLLHDVGHHGVTTYHGALSGSAKICETWCNRSGLLFEGLSGA